MYLGKRDFVDRLDGVVDPIDGVLVVDNDYLKDRRVYGQVRRTCTKSTVRCKTVKVVYGNL